MLIFLTEISEARSSRPSEVMKAVYYDNALSGDSRSCGDTPVKCIDICHSHENRKKKISAIHNIDKPRRYVPITNTMHSLLKPDETDNISLHPVISHPFRGTAGWGETCRRARRLCHRKKSYISLGYAKRTVSHNEPSRGRFSMRESVSM